jgi:hypothetical protein
MTSIQITAETETEAAIYAEGTGMTKADIIQAYAKHLATADEPLDIQRFCETVLVLSGNFAPTSERVTKMADEAAQHGDIFGSALCAKAIGSDYSQYALTPQERAKVDAMSQTEAMQEVRNMFAAGQG